MYVFQLLKRRGFAAELVPGISAASAGAALAGISLARDQESVAVVFADLGLPGEYVGELEADRDYGYFTTVIVNKKYDRT